MSFLQEKSNFVGGDVLDAPKKRGFLIVKKESIVRKTRRKIHFGFSERDVEDVVPYKKCFAVVVINIPKGIMQ